MLPPSSTTIEGNSCPSVLNCPTEASLRELVELQRLGSPGTIENVAVEMKRLRAVAPFLELGNDARVDALTEELRCNLSVSWTAVGLLDVSRQVLKSVSEHPDMPFGLPNTTPRKKHSLVRPSDGTLQVVPDTWEDRRFHENPYVKHDPTKPYSIRFFASTPVHSNGSHIGDLCVFHHAPKQLTSQESTKLAQVADQIGKLLVTGRSRSQEEGKTRKRSTSRDDSEIGRRNRQTDITKSPTAKRRSASCGPLLSLDLPNEETSELATTNITIIQNPSSCIPSVPLPDPKTSHADPDEFLEQLLLSMAPELKFKIQSSHEIADFFPTVTEAQMARYNVNVVSMARNNELEGIKNLFDEEGRDALDCYNRFGEGLLTLACRRGFKDMTEFFLSEDVDLPVRVRDDYGRTPVHDACWNPEPQLEICSWILAKDPSLFLLADKRGFTAFQYARKSDWQVWRQFLFEHRHFLKPLTQPELAKRFEKK